MAIDGCPHSFRVLAAKILPGHMKVLRRAMGSPYRARIFKKPGCGVKGLLKVVGREKDFPGLYVLLENRMPIYVGISRRVVARLRQHLTGRTHFDASLVYAMARKKWNGKGRRGALMKSSAFRKAFAAAQGRLSKCKVAFVEITDPVTLYLFEGYAAIKFNCAWNTFRTH
jgi:hypothetical protein